MQIDRIDVVEWNDEWSQRREWNMNEVEANEAEWCNEAMNGMSNEFQLISFNYRNELMKFNEINANGMKQAWSTLNQLTQHSIHWI